MAPLQRRLEGELGQTMPMLLGSEVSELAWERAKLPTCFGGLRIRVAQMGFAAQATYWSAVDLHKAVMTNICEALNRPIREMHPEIAAALAAKTDLLVPGSLLMSMPEGRLRMRAENCTRQARGRRIVRLAPGADGRQGPAKKPCTRLAFAKLQSRILSAAEAVQAAKLHCEMLPEQQAISSVRRNLARAGRPCTSHRQNCHRLRNMEDGHGVTTLRCARRWSAIYVCSEEGH